MYHDNPLVERRRSLNIKPCKQRDIRKLIRGIYFTGIMFIIALLDLMINLVDFEHICKI